MRQTIFCDHYRAMSEHKTCSAGVEYEKFKGVPFEQRPCFCKPGKPAPGGCEFAQFPTAEELAKQEEEDRRRFDNTIKAREAIVAFLGGPWKKGTKGGSGIIECPVCGEKQSLHFHRAGSNGHIHAACATVGCVSWME